MKKAGTGQQDLIRRLLESTVKASIGEPWDFGNGKERNPFEAVIEKISIRLLSHGRETELQEALLLRIKQPFPYDKLKCEFLLATPRHVGIGLEALSSGKLVAFNFKRIPKDHAQSDDPFQSRSDDSGKNYFALIGSLTLSLHKKDGI